MSKSLGNIVDPWIMIEKYGVDTLRLWMYCVNQPGESKNFDEKTVALLHQQVFSLLYNVLTFYELYRDKELEKISQIKSKNILDQWILARLNELIKLSTENIEDYKLLEPTRAIRDFIGDLSTWYLRRSRERIKEGDKEAKQTLYFVLKTFTKIMAPFAPFSAEDIWLKLKNDPRHGGASNDAKSVHLEKWPKTQKSIFEVFTKKEVKILENMEVVRKIVTLGLEARQKAGIKVRQPLNQLKIRNYKLGIEYTELIKDELNVKELVEDENLEGEVLLDTEITEELKAECDCRELSRAVQDMRKKLGLTPSDVISLVLKTDDAGKKLVQKFETDMKKTVLASEIEFKDNDGEEVKIDDLVFKVKIKK
jgi:isoleucyl-tRNA synthetase